MASSTSRPVPRWRIIIPERQDGASGTPPPFYRLRAGRTGYPQPLMTQKNNKSPPSKRGSRGIIPLAGVHGIVGPNPCTSTPKTLAKSPFFRVFRSISISYFFEFGNLLASFFVANFVLIFFPASIMLCSPKCVYIRAVVE